jgi:HlyD family type I secretion membrane fusion protein
MKHQTPSDFVVAPPRAKADVEPARLDVFRLWPRILSGLSLALVLLIGCGGWAALAKLEGAVVTSGIVKVDQNLKEVQHRDGGIVKTLAVRQGDSVTEGQVLATLDDVQIKAELMIVKSQLGESLGRKSRLVSERDNLSSISFPDELKLLSTTSEDIIIGETRLFKGNYMARESQKQQLELAVEQTGEEIKGMAARLAAKIDESNLVGEERTKLVDLFDRRIVDYSRVYVAHRDWVRIQGERGEIISAIARAKARTSEIRVQIIAVDQNATTEAQRELRTVDARIAELNERMLAIDDRLFRTKIRSPIAGIVNELFAFTIGGVISPAARIATIVPDTAELKFEVKVSLADIDQVRTGQNARVRLTAFNRSTTPEMAATVTMVSPASAKDPTNGQEHYIAYISLNDAVYLKQNKMRLLPGMPAEVFIATQERTAGSYLLKPFIDQMNRAFKER